MQLTFEQFEKTKQLINESRALSSRGPRTSLARHPIMQRNRHARSNLRA